MIVCPNCEHHNPDQAEACAACGGALEGFLYRVCPDCGALNPAQNTFCQRCLAELNPAAQAARPLDDDAIAPFAPTEPLPDDALLEPIEATPPAADAPPPPTQPAHHPQPEQPAAVADSLADDEVPAEEPETEAAAAVSSAPPPLGHEPTALGAAVDLNAILPDDLIGDLAGPQDLLPLEAAVSLPHRAHPPTFPRASETEQFDAELFAHVVTEPASLHESRQIVLQRQPRILPGLGRAALYLLVLLAALTPLLTGGQLFTAGRVVQPGLEAVALAQALDALPAGAHLLISIDYTPAYAGEVDLLTQILLRQLAEREVNLVIMSTQPAGMGLAERALAVVSQETSAYANYGERHALVGYLAGNEAALRTLSGSVDAAFKRDHVEHKQLSQLPATEGLATLSEVDAIVVLSDDGQVVRRWVEQVHSRTQRPLYALVSARIKPLLQPYLSSGQLAALVGGAAQTAEYQAASLGSAWELAQGDAYVAYFGVLVLVAIITNIAYLARRRAQHS